MSKDEDDFGIDDDVPIPKKGHNSRNRDSDVTKIVPNELRNLIERYERLADEKTAITEEQRDLMQEAKAKGYDTKIMRQVIALRKKDADDAADEAALLRTYTRALGMTILDDL